MNLEHLKYYYVDDWLAKKTRSCWRMEVLQAPLYRLFKQDLGARRIHLSPKEFARTVLRLRPEVSAERSGTGQWMFCGLALKNRMSPYATQRRFRIRRWCQPYDQSASITMK